MEQVPLNLNVLTLFEIVRKYQLIYVSCVDCNFVLNERKRDYFQVQLQMFTLGVKYCNFFVWSPSDMIVIQVLFNENFCSDIIDKANTFYEQCVMTELLCKFFYWKSLNQCLLLFATT